MREKEGEGEGQSSKTDKFWTSQCVPQGQNKRNNRAACKTRMEMMEKWGQQMKGNSAVVADEARLHRGELRITLIFVQTER